MPLNISLICFSSLEESACSLINKGCFFIFLIILPYPKGFSIIAVRIDNFFREDTFKSLFKVSFETIGTSEYRINVFPLSGIYGVACFTACPVPSLSFCSQKIKFSWLLSIKYFFTSSFL